MGARCEACQGQVMPYSKYMFWWKPTATCADCGAEVRLRGFSMLVVAGLVLGAAGLWYIVDQEGRLLWFLGALAVAAFVADYGTFHFLSWAATGTGERGGEPRDAPGVDPSAEDSPGVRP